MKTQSHLLKAAVFLTSAIACIGSAGAAPRTDLGAVPFAAVAIDRLPADQTEMDAAELAPNLRRQVVSYSRSDAPGTVVIDIGQTYLYYVLGDGRAIRYGIGVGREGFTWSGVETVTRKAEWPDWTPPAEMIARQPYLARFTAGGEGNPLGARAIYLGKTVYRIHGTNMPDTIGRNVSSGCIRLLNADIIDLYGRISIGARVIVLPAHSQVAGPVASAVPVRFDASSAAGPRASETY
jgi:lipoprotein-anchoring transpeptidase ErfK/SrfK